MWHLLKTLYFHILSLDFVAILPAESTRESVRIDGWNQAGCGNYKKKVIDYNNNYFHFSIPAHNFNYRLHIKVKITIVEDRDYIRNYRLYR